MEKYAFITKKVTRCGECPNYNDGMGYDDAICQYVGLISNSNFIHPNCPHLVKE